MVMIASPAPFESANAELCNESLIRCLPTDDDELVFCRGSGDPSCFAHFRCANHAYCRHYDGYCNYTASYSYSKAAETPTAM
jgi:hypothetical protein